MANFVLQELPDEMTDGKKIVYPKMQTQHQRRPHPSSLRRTRINDAELDAFGP